MCFQRLMEQMLVFGTTTEIKGGSRNRELEVGKDNAGFLCSVLEEEAFDGIKEFLKAFPNATVFGEWLVPHSLKTYREDAWRKFYIFDIVINDLEQVIYFTYEEIQEVCNQFKMNYIPCIQIIKNGDYENFVKCLEKNNFLIKDGEGNGEGIVIKNYDYKNQYGRVTWAKIVTSEFKEKHCKEMGSPQLENKMIEQEFVDNHCTEALIEKTYAKIVNAEDGWSGKYIPRLLNTVFHDLVNEEIWNFIKSKKQPTINFKTVNFLVINKIKIVKKELF